MAFSSSIVFNSLERFSNITSSMLFTLANLDIKSQCSVKESFPALCNTVLLFSVFRSFEYILSSRPSNALRTMPTCFIDSSFLSITPLKEARFSL